MALSLPDFLPLILQQLREALGSRLLVSAGPDAARLTVHTRDFLVTELLPGGAGPAQLTSGASCQAPRSIAVAPYIPLVVAQRLRQQGQYYADAMGNVWLEDPSVGMALLVTGMRSRKLPAAGGAAFQLQGLRLLFYLLSNPELLRCSDAEVAKQTKVQRSVTTETLLSLEQQGFLEVWAGRRLVNLTALTARWVAGYRDVLRPRLPTQRYRWVTGWQGKLAWFALARRTKSLLGGAVAARRLLKCDLVPTTFTLYHHSAECLPLLRNVGLEPHPDGPVEVVHLFDTPVVFPKDRCVHPLFIYAELMVADDASRRVAELILRQYLPHLAA